MRYRCFSFVLVVIAMISYAMPSQAQQQEDIVDRLNASLGVFLPSQYQTTVKNFVMNSKILSDKDAQTFTELFIKEQMNTNWGIDKQNQLLFIWDAIYGQIHNNKQLYTGEDGNQTRLDEFEKVIEKAEECEKKYNAEFRAYMRKLSAEADRSFAEARQQNVIITYYGLYLNTDFYTMRNAASESEIEQTKEYFKHNVKNCKKYKIDFQFLLPTEVQSFYDLNPVQQNSITCDESMVHILNIVLQEIVKLYNLYQKAPQLIREIPNFKSFIDACKKHDIDYKKELTPEMLKYFGIE